jgi:hypothetical protein
VWMPSLPTGWHVSACWRQSPRTEGPNSLLLCGWYAVVSTSLGIKHVVTTAYHPQSSGMVKCMHRQLKDALRACGAGLIWHSHLPWVLMVLRATPKEDSAVSSAELVMGTPLVLPGQLLHVPDPPCVNMLPPPTRPASYAAAANTPLAHLAQSEHLYVRVGGQQKPLAAP